MAAPQNSFTIRKYEGFGGSFVDSDHLATTYDAGRPYIFDQIMMKVFTAQNRFANKPLLGMTLAANNYKMIDNERYRWKLEGAEEKSLRVVENVESGNATPGINGDTFKIKLDEGWCKAPDVLMGEDNEYPLRIVGEPVYDDDGYIYTVVLQTNDTSKSFPASALEPNKEFYKVWTSTSSEFNEEFGTMQFGANFELESQLSTFAQEFIVTDKAMRESGRLGIPLRINGEKKEKFIPVAEMKMREELYMSMEAQLMYGKRWDSENVGTKYRVSTGPGLREQLKDGHRQVYSGSLTVDFLRDYLLDIFFARKGKEDRKVTIMTGTMGAIMFHEMLAAQTSGNNFFTAMHEVGKISESPRYLSYGAQFTHYQGPEGIEVDLVLNPLYDDIKYCRRTHPDYPGKPIDSWRMTILDFGNAGEDSKGNPESNIQLLKLQDYSRYGYVPGSVSPTGPVQGGSTVSAKAGCQYFVEDSAGIMVKDAARTGELILDFED